MKEIGKAYANRKKIENRPVGDFYATPKSLIWVMKQEILKLFPLYNSITEPCFGNGDISDELIKIGYEVITNDLYNNNGNFQKDFLKDSSFCSRAVITNFPFSVWDKFLIVCKEKAEKILVIGRLNYLATNSRLQANLWEGLKTIYIFNRYVDYRTESRIDGHFHVGAMATGWFYFEKGYMGKPYFEIVDVQKYATLGNIK